MSTRHLSLVRTYRTDWDDCVTESFWLIVTPEGDDDANTSDEARQR
jgi:hypothetical protein